MLVTLCFKINFGPLFVKVLLYMVFIDVRKLRLLGHTCLSVLAMCSCPVFVHCLKVRAGGQCASLHIVLRSTRVPLRHE
jgi:hypothetical protein